MISYHIVNHKIVSFRILFYDSMLSISFKLIQYMTSTLLPYITSQETVPHHTINYCSSKISGDTAYIRTSLAMPYIKSEGTVSYHNICYATIPYHKAIYCMISRFMNLSCYGRIVPARSERDNYLTYMVIQLRRLLTEV